MALMCDQRYTTLAPTCFGNFSKHEVQTKSLKHKRASRAGHTTEETLGGPSAISLMFLMMAYD